MSAEGRGRLRADAPTNPAAIERHFARHLTDREIRVLTRALSRVVAAEEAIG